MTPSLRDEFRTLPQRFGAAWNRFWFAPSDPLVLCALRIATGLVTFYLLFTFSPDIRAFFAAGGLLPAEAVEAWAREHAAPGSPVLNLLTPPVQNFSYLTYVTNPNLLMALHVAGLGVLLAFTLGLLTRATSIASLIVVLSYMHRAPMLVSQVEPIVAMMLFYLCLAPCGAYWSVDAWWRNRRVPGAERGQPPSTSQDVGPAQPQLRDDSPLTPALSPEGRGRLASPWVTVTTRLMQIHISALYVMIALAQLSGGASSPWWTGQAVWMLVSRPEMPLVNMTWLAGHPFLIDFWTRFIVGVELAFPLLVWRRSLRPFALGAAVFMWAGLALITGLTAFCLMMVVASCSFVPPQWLRASWENWARPRETATASGVSSAGVAQSSASDGGLGGKSPSKPHKARQAARTR